MESEDKSYDDDNEKQGKCSNDSNNWLTWCRLCSARDASTYFDVFDKSDDQADAATIASEIGKYFWVKIKSNDKMPHRVCEECHTLIEELSGFTDRVNKVQAMFCFLLNTETTKVEDEAELVKKFGLVDEQWHHIIKSKNKTEPCACSSKAPSILEENQVCDSPTMVACDSEVAARLKLADEELSSDKDFAGFVSHTEDDVNGDGEVDENDSDIYLEIKSNEENSTNIDDSDISSYEYFETMDDKEGLDQEVTQLKRKRECKASDAAITSKFRKSGSSTKFDCKMCPKKYKSLLSYRRHLADQHAAIPDVPGYECQICETAFTTEHKLNMHNRKHMSLEEKLIVPCMYCDKKFTLLSVMKQHVSSVHLNEKPYVCDICGRALKTLAAFNDHKKIHSDETPFECEVCHKSFKTKIRLKMHSEVHAEESFKCTECDLVLSTKRTLKMHMLVHSDAKEHKCDFCGAEFKRAKALKNHLILHSGMRPYKCNFCSKTFTNGSNCRAHKKKLHPMELAEEEAQGVKIITKMPKMDELKSCKNVRTVMPTKRIGGGLTGEMRALIIAAEKRKQKIEEYCKRTVKSLKREKENSELDEKEFVFEYACDAEDGEGITNTEASATIYTNIDDTDDTDDGSQTIVYEVIDEIN